MAVPSWFDAEYYIAAKAAKDGKESPAVTQGDLDAAGYTGVEGAYRHYEEWGKAEGVEPFDPATFDEDAYLAAKAAHDAEVSGAAPKTVEALKAELAEANMSAIDHFMTYGEVEGTPYVLGEAPGDVPGDTPGDVPGDTPGDVPSEPGVVKFFELPADASGSPFKPVETADEVLFQAQQSSVAGGGDNIVTAYVDAEDITAAGAELTLGSVDSRADLAIEDVRHASNMTTILMQNTDPGDVDLNVYFDPQHLVADGAEKTGTLDLKLIDIRGEVDADQPLLSNTYDAVRFNLNGEDVTLNFGIVNGPDATYQNLVDAINTALQANPMFEGVTAAINGTFSVNDPKTDGMTATGQVITLTAKDGVITAPVEGNGWIATQGVPANSDLSTNMSDSASETCPLIKANVQLDNVGRVQWDNAQPECLPDDVIYGSNAGDLVVGSMADRGGVQRLDVTVDRGSWLSSISSTNEALRMVTVKAEDINGDGQSGGQLFIGDWNGVGGYAGNQETAGTYALSNQVNALWTEKPVFLENGLEDVAVFDAAGYAGDINLGATITAAAQYKYLQEVDGTADGWAPLAGYGDAFTYNTGAGNDVLNLKADMAAAGDVDFQLNVNTDAGDDAVQFAFTNALGLVNQAANQKALDNVLISTGAGADEVYFVDTAEVAGGVARIDAGAGDDLIYANTYLQGDVMDNAIFVLNAEDPTLGDIKSTAGSFATGGDKGDVLSVTVSYFGHESTVEVGKVGEEGMVDAEAINHAIMNAIAASPALDAVLAAQDGAGYSLKLGTGIDGATVEDLVISFGMTGPDGAEKAVDAALTDAYATQSGREDAGTKSDTQAFVDGGAGDDIYVLGDNDLEDIVTVSKGDNDTIFGFEQGTDKINVSALGVDLADIAVEADAELANTYNLLDADGNKLASVVTDGKWEVAASDLTLNDVLSSGEGGEEPAFTITSSVTEVEEGSSVIFTLEAAEGSTLEDGEYAITISGLTAEDVEGEYAQSFVVTDGVCAPVEIKLAKDAEEEPGESFTVSTTVGETEVVSAPVTVLDAAAGEEDYTLTAAELLAESSADAPFVASNDGENWIFNFEGAKGGDYYIEGFAAGDVLNVDDTSAVSVNIFWESGLADGKVQLFYTNASDELVNINLVGVADAEALLNGNDAASFVAAFGEGTLV